MKQEIKNYLEENFEDLIIEYYAETPIDLFVDAKDLIEDSMIYITKEVANELLKKNIKKEEYDFFVNVVQKILLDDEGYAFSLEIRANERIDEAREINPDETYTYAAIAKTDGSFYNKFKEVN